MEPQRRSALLLLGGSLAAAALYLYLTSSKTPERSKNKVCGLYNLGNTCYANALIQGLSSLPSLVHWLEKLRCDSERTAFVRELRKLVLDLQHGDGSTLSAWPVSEALLAHGWNVAAGVEQDLHELLNVFQSTWEEELAETRRRLLSASLIHLHALKLQQDCFDGPSGEEVMARCSEAVKVDGELRAPCTGLFATQLRCVLPNCGFKKVRHDKFSVIPLTIPKDFQRMRVGVECLLRHFFCGELIRGASCDACRLLRGQHNTGLFKKHGFAKLPPCLLLRIERVGVLPSGAAFKIGQQIAFPSLLNVKDLCFYRSKQTDYASSSTSSLLSAGDGRPRIVGGSSTGPAPFTAPASSDYPPLNMEDEKYVYSLRAVSEHRGVPETGHFVTYRRGVGCASNSWFLTNDSRVTRVSYQQVASAQAYMLYYERLRPSSPA